MKYASVSRDLVKERWGMDHNMRKEIIKSCLSKSSSSSDAKKEEMEGDISFVARMREKLYQSGIYLRCLR